MGAPQQLRAYRRIKPKRAPTGLAGIPDRNDLLRLGDRPALGLSTLGLSRSLGGWALGGSDPFPEAMVTACG
jgi:hypothetical protein